MFSVEVLNVYNSKIFFLSFISDMKLTTQSNSFLYRYHYNVSIFFQILAEEITPTLTKLKEVHLLCIKRAVIMCSSLHKIMIAKHPMFQELSW